MSNPALDRDRILNAPRIDIPDHFWVESGEYLDERDPRKRLLATIVVANTSMHLEAYEVATNDDGEQRLIDSEADSALLALVGPDPYPLTTTTIQGREYILIATPHGD